jgi:hypothetical protein
MATEDDPGEWGKLTGNGQKLEEYPLRPVGLNPVNTGTLTAKINKRDSFRQNSCCNRP